MVNHIGEVMVSIFTLSYLECTVVNHIGEVMSYSIGEVP